MRLLIYTTVLMLLSILVVGAQVDQEWNWHTAIKSPGHTRTMRDYGAALIIPVDPPTKHCLTELKHNKYRWVIDTLGVYDITEDIPKRYFEDPRVVEPGYLILYDSVSTKKIIKQKKKYIRAVKPVYGLPKLKTDYENGINYVLLSRINVHKYDLLETLCWEHVDEEFIDLVISKLDLAGYPVSQDYEILDEDYQPDRRYVRYRQRESTIENKVGTYHQRNTIRQPKPQPLSNLADPDIHQKILRIKENRMFKALRDYQYDRILLTGYLDIETLSALGIDLRPYEVD